VKSNHGGYGRLNDLPDNFNYFIDIQIILPVVLLVGALFRVACQRDDGDDADPSVTACRTRSHSNAAAW
jgi:hypothetical protein